ncbi:MAG: thioredoxin-dependent thiol peroxidase [Zetaproteobacteria bacterium]|nr:thioredoxin-dependent thiol peroxidase [Pseudobdellovibrionaceae bacterium]
MKLIETGEKAPLFTLKDQDGVEHSLKDYLGQKVILYFYPKDMTPGCTQEACDFNDSLKKIKSKEAIVFGVSKDTQEKHKKFSDKYSLSFPLLSDSSSKVCEKYGVWKEKKLYGKSFMGIVRTTYILDEKLVVVERFDKVKVKDHVKYIVDNCL